MVPVGAGTDGKAGSCWSMDHCWDKSMSSLHLGLLAFFLPHCTCIGIYWKRHVVPVWSAFKNLATTQVQEWWHPTPKLDCMIASNLGEYLYGEGVWQLLYYFAEETGDPLLECIGEILERYWRDIGEILGWWCDMMCELTYWRWILYLSGWCANDPPHSWGATLELLFLGLIPRPLGWVGIWLLDLVLA